MSLQGQSLQACTTCRSRKKKCDKRFPKCSLCTRRLLRCSYNPRATSNHRHNPDLLQGTTTCEQLPPDSPTQALGPVPGAPEEKTRNHGQNFSLQTIGFPSVLFLDSSVSQKYQIEIPKFTLELPTCVTSMIGDLSQMQCTARHYFDTVHEWIPIISKKRFYEHLNPFYPLRADYALLILCMDLISWVPGSDIDDVRNPTYLTAKRYYLDLEIAGVLSIQALQAGILIALFEIGHAIYPSAFLTVAACARYGSALDLDRRTASPRKEPISWVDTEEENRVWWAIVLLDRIVNVGKPERPLLIPEPGASVVLPGNDEEWDKGISPSKPFLNVTTIELGDMGPFALVSQATRLLGQVLRHISDPSRLDEEEAVLLDGTLRALYQVVFIEGQLQGLHMLNQQAICSIALILLHEAHASRPDKTRTSIHFHENHHYKRCISSFKTSADEACFGTYRMDMDVCVGNGSPFVVFLLYNIARASARQYKENASSESSHAVETMKSALVMFNTKWKLSSTFLKVLKAREMV